MMHMVISKNIVKKKESGNDPAVENMENMHFPCLRTYSTVLSQTKMSNIFVFIFILLFDLTNCPGEKMLCVKVVDPGFPPVVVDSVLSSVCTVCAIHPWIRDTGTLFRSLYIMFVLRLEENSRNILAFEHS